MKETELYEPVKQLLQESLGCSTVYGEICGYDVVGFRGPADVIVEMKTTLNFKVIEQAYGALQTGHFIYIAVPAVKSSHHFIYHQFLKPYGIGLIYVKPNHYSEAKWRRYFDAPYYDHLAEVVYDAAFNHIASKRNRAAGKMMSLRASIKEWSDQNIGGSKGGETVTDYSVMIGAVQSYLEENEWATLSDILRNVSIVSEHYMNPKASLRATLREKWNEHWLQMSYCYDRREPIYALKQSDATSRKSSMGELSKKLAEEAMYKQDILITEPKNEKML